MTQKPLLLAAIPPSLYYVRRRCYWLFSQFRVRRASIQLELAAGSPAKSGGSSFEGVGGFGALPVRTMRLKKKPSWAIAQGGLR